MITAVIRNKEDTLVIDLPHDIYDLYEKMHSVGIWSPPQKIKLTDNEDEDIGVKLFSDNDFGNHLLGILGEDNTLADANMLTTLIQDASPEIKEELEQNVLYDQYTSMSDVVRDIKKMIDEAGPVKVTFYCPLEGHVIDEDGLESGMNNRYLQSYQWAIEELIESRSEDDTKNMAEYFDQDEFGKRKLVSAVWGVECYRGKLYGKIECSLTEELTDDETEKLKDWISGQNSDGWGEGFEQQPIETEDGELFVSFWNSGDDYAIMTKDELDEYIESQNVGMGGM